MDNDVTLRRARRYFPARSPRPLSRSFPALTALAVGSLAFPGIASA